MFNKNIDTFFTGIDLNFNDVFSFILYNAIQLYKRQKIFLVYDKT